MGQEWIRNYNQKCAEFLGWKETTDEFKIEWTGCKTKERLDRIDKQYIPILEKNGDVLFPDFSVMDFTNDWNWIHVVVEKINDVILSKEHDEKETVLVYLRHNIRDYLGASLKIPLIRAINDFLDKHLEYYGN